MSIERCLHGLKSAEKAAGDLYATVSLNTSLRFPALSDLFQELAEEEMIHVRQFEMCQAFQASDESSFMATPQAQKQIDEFLMAIQWLSNEFLKRADQLTERQIIEMALKIETHMVEQHQELLIRVTHTELKTLFESLKFADIHHTKKLTDYLRSLPG